MVWQYCWVSLLHEYFFKGQIISISAVENPDIFLGIAHKAERVVVAVAEDLASATSVMKRDTWHETVPTRTRPIEGYAD